MIDASMIKNLQRELHTRVDQVNEKLDEENVVGSAGGGVVKVTVSGNRVVKAVEIGAEAIDPDDPEMLQDLIMAATNQALENAKKLHEERMGAVTGGLKLPGLF
ncbi:MAG: YbaB/EbfC family nucleoid-associated protein [Sumerlaeia bacterium]